MKIVEKLLALKTQNGERSVSSSSASSASSSLLSDEDVVMNSTMKSRPAMPKDILPPPPQKAVNPYYSFEFFPPKTEAGLDNLYERIDRMKELEPLFIDVTWGAGGGTERETVAIASYAQQYCGLDVLMHLTATGLTKDQVRARS
jgi:hypothetical protein